MTLNNQKNISDEFADTELGAEMGVPPQYHAAARKAGGAIEGKGYQGMPIHPITKQDDNEEQTLGI